MDGAFSCRWKTPVLIVLRVLVDEALETEAPEELCARMCMASGEVRGSAQGRGWPG